MINTFEILLKEHPLKLTSMNMDIVKSIAMSAVKITNAAYDVFKQEEDK